MTKEQTDEFRNLLRRILANQVDPKLLMSVLDEIKKGQIRLENGVLRIESTLATMRKKYFPDGTTVETPRPGSFIGGDGENAAYKNMFVAQQAGDGATLLRLAQEEIAKVPEWLTPIAFRGIAYALLGRNEEAIRDLTTFIDHVPAQREMERTRSPLV